MLTIIVYVNKMLMSPPSREGNFLDIKGKYMKKSALTTIISILLIAVSLFGLAAAGFFLGIAFAVLYDRRLRARGGLRFTIVRLF